VKDQHQPDYYHKPFGGTRDDFIELLHSIPGVQAILLLHVPEEHSCVIVYDGDPKQVGSALRQFVPMHVRVDAYEVRSLLEQAQAPRWPSGFWFSALLVLLASLASQFLVRDQQLAAQVIWLVGAFVWVGALCWLAMGGIVLRLRRGK
jgi:hypothetical protein